MQLGEPIMHILNLVNFIKLNKLNMENIKKLKLVLLLFALVMLASCKKEEKLTFTHYATGGLSEEYEMDIIFEQSNSTFTAYQVAYSSCTCRDAITNYKSICYVEILNTKESGEDASIRYITLGENKGLYGDSNPNYNIASHDDKFFELNLVKPLIGITKKEMDKFTGYGYVSEAVDADAVSGATVTTSNIQSMLKSLFKYHKEKYYNGK